MKVLAHPMRLQILQILGSKPTCVSRIVELTGQRQAKVSQQLAVLKDAGLIACCREGWNVRYYLKQPQVIELIEEAHRYNLWYPRIVVDRCDGCGMCVVSCNQEVFGFNDELNRPVIVKRLRCVVGCSTCATICEREALKFPSRVNIRVITQE